ncbi:hypothetical protein GDO86_014654 [Hymenochirus boettgeri]|uniref:Bcl-2-like protein 1 n=2 Tax=Hymenochirus TaxID=8361 RepID=A0A8T2JVG0_9PIPI|nr:hypothetical protein GDO86_014654 [Hymenochirus boettgeri]KAG8447268.1 hypothetical protein GDO86_014654 [Hymenochirus boettgeri]
MEGSSRDLVEKFVCTKLNQKGVSRHLSSNSHPKLVSNGTSAGDESEPAREGNMESSVLLALQDASDEFELRYQRAFNDLTSQLHITQDTAYQSFQQVVGELFRDGTNWGRIVAFLAFGRALCVESANKEMTDLQPRIVQWMAHYLDNTLQPWIQDNGGWEGFVTLYGKDAAARSRKSQERFGRWMVTIMTLAGVFFLFSYLSRR